MRELTHEDLADLTPLVWSIVRRRFATVPAHVAEPDDLYQYGMEGATRAARRFKRGHGASFTTWTTAAAHRAIQDALRTLKNGPRHGEPLPVTSLDQHSPDHDESWVNLIEDDTVDLDRGLVADALARAIATLPLGQREALRLYYVVGLTLREAGELLGISEAGTCQRLRAAHRTLRESPLLAGLG